MSRRTSSRPPSKHAESSTEKLPAPLVDLLDVVPLSQSARDGLSASLQLILRPHTVTILLMTVFVLLQFAHVDVTDHGFRKSVLRGVWGAVVLFLTFMAIHGPNTTAMTRPHPIFWRLVLAVSLCYVCLLAFILFQPIDTVRAMFSFLDPTLAIYRTHPERTYTDQGCDIYTPHNPAGAFANVWAVWKDEFVIAHVLGYVAKAVMLRDWRLVTLCSVVFELLEVALQHRLPNFRECWCDHGRCPVCHLRGGLGRVTRGRRPSRSRGHTRKRAVNTADHHAPSHPLRRRRRETQRDDHTTSCVRAPSAAVW